LVHLLDLVLRVFVLALVRYESGAVNEFGTETHSLDLVR